MIKGLNAGQAVKCGDKYLVGLNPYHRYEVNEEVVVGSQVIVEDINSVVRIQTSPSKVEYFTDSGGEKFEPSEVYKYRHGDIEDYEEPEQKIEFLQKQSWAMKLEPHMTQEKVEKVPVEFEVVGSLEDTGSQFIETSLSYGSVKFPRSGGMYKVHTGRVARDEIKRLSERYSGATLNLPSHGHLEFVKVDGSYVFTGTAQPYIKKPEACVVVDNLKDAQAAEEEVRQVIRKVAQPFFNPKKVSEIDTTEVLRELALLKRMLAGLKLKVSSNTSVSSLHRQVEKIEKVLSEAQEGGTM